VINPLFVNFFAITNLNENIFSDGLWILVCYITGLIPVEYRQNVFLGWGVWEV